METGNNTNKITCNPVIVIDAGDRQRLRSRGLHMISWGSVGAVEGEEPRGRGSEGQNGGEARADT